MLKLIFILLDALADGKLTVEEVKTLFQQLLNFPGD